MENSSADLPAPAVRLGAGETGASLELAIVIPTYNERENVVLLAERLKRVLADVSWEAIFVDDDSPDGTAEVVRGLGAADSRIRVLQRIGRRGLASACIEGMLATSARFVAVMDADLQHDESILPVMLAQIRQGDIELVVATRKAGGGNANLGGKRLQLSNLGARLSGLVCQTPLSDPMSGFFMITRACFQQVARKLCGTGFKILVDIVASAGRELALAEVPYTFRRRQHGESKLEISVGMEYVYLLLDKITHGLLPPRFAMFLFVGGTGMAVHMAVLSWLYAFRHLQFLLGQTIAAVVAMTWNFFLNNAITFSDVRLRGWRMLMGLCMFYLTCSFGVLTNITVAQYVFAHEWPWMLAAFAGIAVSSVWNYVISSILAWHRKAA
jgi:dolichol-phosphate mannosyltransferase